jgi:outer membrane protein assembly factor BamB
MPPARGEPEPPSPGTPDVPHAPPARPGPGGRTPARRRRRRIVLAIAVVIAAAAVGVAVVVRAPDGGSDVWESEVARSAQHLVTDGQTVCGGDDGLLFCLDAATGEVRFTDRPADEVTPMSIVDGTVLVAEEPSDSAESVLAAFSLDGEEMWTTPLVEPPLDALPVIDGVVALRAASVASDATRTALTDHDLVGLDLATGEDRWRVATARNDVDVRVVGNVLSDGEHFLYSDQTMPMGPDGASAIVAIDPGTGAELWRSPWERGDRYGFPGIYDAAPVDGGSAVAVVGGLLGQQVQLTVLDVANGEVRWRAPLGPYVAAVAHLDGVTVAYYERELRGYDRDGEQLWAAPAPLTGELPNPTHVRYGDLAVERDVLYFSGSGSVHELDPASGASRPAVDGSALDWVVTDERLVVARPCCRDGWGPIEGLPLDRRNR